MESSTTFTSVPSSSTQSTPLVGTASVHTSSTVSNIPNLTVAPNASIELTSPVLVSIPSVDSSITFTSTPSTSTQPVSPATASIPSSTSNSPFTSVLTLNTGTQCVNVISKYLVQYVFAATQKDKSSSTKVTESRVLTSAEGLAILKEKEEKKQKEKEEKDKRKERLDKQGNRTSWPRRKQNKRPVKQVVSRIE